MKNISLLFGCIITFYSCNNNETSKNQKVNNIKKQTNLLPLISNPCATLLQIEHLKGKVKKVSQSTFHAKKKSTEFEKIVLGNIYVTTFDTKGNGIEKLYFNSSKKLQTTTKYETVTTSKCPKAIVYGSSKSIFKTTKYTYDASSNLSLTADYINKGILLSKQVYKYNINNLLIEEIKYDANHFDMKITYKYNNTNDIIETRYYRPENTMIVFCKTTYSHYDIKGNWLKSIEQTNKGSLFIVERAIEYYE